MFVLLSRSLSIRLLLSDSLGLPGLSGQKSQVGKGKNWRHKSTITPNASQWSNIFSLMQWLYWSLLSAVFAAATAVLAKIGVTGIDSNVATAIRTSVILVFTWLIAFSTAGVFSVEKLPARTWLFLVLSGIATGLSWLCYFRALQLGPASRVAPVDKLSVVFVLLLAAGFLGERLTLMKFAGGVLIAAGAIVLAIA